MDDEGKASATILGLGAGGLVLIIAASDHWPPWLGLGLAMVTVILLRILILL